MKKILSILVIAVVTTSLLTACEKDTTLEDIFSSMIEDSSLSQTAQTNISESSSSESLPSSSSRTQGSPKSSTDIVSSPAVTSSSQAVTSIPVPTKDNDFSYVLPLLNESNYSSMYTDIVVRGDKNGVVAVGCIYSGKPPIGVIDKFDLELNVVQSVRLKDTNISCITNAVDGGYLLISMVETTTLIKLDKDLNEEWRTPIDNIYGKPCQLDNGDIVLLKTSFPTEPECAMFVYDKTGKFKIKNTLLTHGDMGIPSIEKGKDGSFFVIGGVVEAKKTSGVPIKGFGFGSEDAFLLKFSEDYTLIWSKGFGGNKQDFFEKIYIDNEFLYAVMGSNSADKNLAGLSLSGDGIARVLFKMDNSGTVLQRTVLSKYGYAVPVIGGITKKGENLIVAGWSRYGDGILNQYPVKTGPVTEQMTTVNSKGEIKDIRLFEIDINNISTAAAFLSNGTVIIPGSKLENNKSAKALYRHTNFNP